MASLCDYYDENTEYLELLTSEDDIDKWLNSIKSKNLRIDDVLKIINKEYIRLKTHILLKDWDFDFKTYALRFSFLMMAFLELLHDTYGDIEQTPSANSHYSEYVSRQTLYTYDSLNKWTAEWESDYEWLRTLLDNNDFLHIYQAGDNLFQLATNLYILFPIEKAG